MLEGLRGLGRPLLCSPMQLPCPASDLRDPASGLVGCPSVAGSWAVCGVPLALPGEPRPAAQLVQSLACMSQVRSLDNNRVQHSYTWVGRSSVTLIALAQARASR